MVLEMMDNPGDIQVGDQTTYTITVKSQGTANVEDLVVTAIIPEDMRFVSARGVKWCS